MAAVVSSAAAACWAASRWRWLTVAAMSCAVFETESIEATMTPPAQALNALAAPRETRLPASTPQTIEAMGGIDR